MSQRIRRFPVLTSALRTRGSDCQHPDVWPAGPVNISTARQCPTGPLFVGEFQGGALDYRGGKGYQACRRRTGSAFQRVFHEGNLAYSATADGNGSDHACGGDAEFVCNP